MSSAALLFFGVLVVTIFLQISPVNSQAQMKASLGAELFIPDAGLELESLDQVQEINEHSFRFYEINPSEELRE